MANPKDDGERPLPPWMSKAKPHGPPGGFTRPPVNPASAPEDSAPSDDATTPRPLPIKRPRRSADVSTIAILMFALPWIAYSLGVIAAVAAALSGGDPTTVIIAASAWLVSGALAFVPATESLIARLLLRARPPTDSERATLDPLWQSVTAAANIDGSKYQLWIEDSEDLNASASAGHIVTITRRALDVMPAHQLSAVLAHELGHHIGGHSWGQFLTYWYSLPGRLLTALMMAIGRFALAVLPAAVGMAAGVLTTILRVLPFGRIVAPLIPILIWILIAVGLLSLAGTLVMALQEPSVLVVIGALIALTLLPPWFSRQGELRADRFAADIGYGPALAQAFEDWLSMGIQTQASLGLRARLFSTHPTLDVRMARLANYTTGVAP